MQRAQLYVAKFPATALALAGLLVTQAAMAGTMARPSTPDPLLGGGNLLDSRPGPCAGLAAGPDYAAGTDAAGNPVVPADVGAPPVPVPDGIAIPLGGGQPQQAGPGRNPVTGNGMMGGAYAEMDGRRLAPLINPPACRR